jgi:hypothetical protein
MAKDGVSQEKFVNLGKMPGDVWRGTYVLIDTYCREEHMFSGSSSSHVLYTSLHG